MVSPFGMTTNCSCDFQKLRVTFVFLIQSLQTLKTVSVPALILLPSKLIMQVIIFQICAKKRLERKIQRTQGEL